ncbi:MAG: DinB family protein [Phototrophicaceae bacterium]
MNADAFRHLYQYHFSENRKTWIDYIMQLSDQQFTQVHDYPIGSVRDQIIHMMNVDRVWFWSLQGLDDFKEFSASDFQNREMIRTEWDYIESKMQAYLADLTDSALLQKPFSEGEDEPLILWQVLLHVANHGTDHRAQVLRLLYDLGIKTTSQDYVFYIMENL